MTFISHLLRAGFPNRNIPTAFFTIPCIISGSNRIGTERGYQSAVEGVVFRWSEGKRAVLLIVLMSCSTCRDLVADSLFDTHVGLQVHSSSPHLETEHLDLTRNLYIVPHFRKLN